MDRITLLTTFVTVVDCGSFSKAAELLGSTQSQISKYIKALEEQWNVSLFIRTTRHLSLTEEAEKILPQVRQAVDQFNAIEQDVRGKESQPQGKLRILTSERWGLAPMASYLSLALHLADLGRHEIRAYSNDSSLIEYKDDASLVTALDKKIESRMREEITQAFPDHGIIGEEYPAKNSSSDFQWVLDPIDGTEEFVFGSPLFGSIISLEYQGNSIVGVIDISSLGLRVHASKGEGTWCGTQRLLLSSEEIPSPRCRLGIPKPLNFSRHGEDGEWFHRLTRSFPNCRIIDSCYATVCVVMGTLDALVHYNVRHWDVSPCRLLELSQKTGHMK
jgi:fructose-1,6-bisphosphatase/inositol monophosphatase family enzyme